MKDRFFTFFLLSFCFASFALAQTKSYQSGKIALLQYDADSRFNNYDSNMKNLESMVDNALQNGANIVVMPEGSTYGYASNSQLWCSPGKETCLQKSCVNVATIAEEVPQGKTTQFWVQKAKTNNAYILFNLPEVDGTTFYNSTVVVGPNGFITKYHKKNLYTVDQCYATPGNENVLLETPYGKFGLMICLDGSYSRSYQEYVKLSVSAVIMSMDWDQTPDGGSRDARNFFQSMANKNQIDILASDVSPWDGTGAYRKSGSARERNGLAPTAVGAEGISYHELAY